MKDVGVKEVGKKKEDMRKIVPVVSVAEGDLEEENHEPEWVEMPQLAAGGREI